MPKMLPDVMCVADTGSARKEASRMSAAETRLAVTASDGAIGVIFLLIVRATRAVANIPPAAIAKAAKR